MTHNSTTTSEALPPLRANHHRKLFWTSDDFTEPEETNNNRLAFSCPLKSGILAVLPEPDRPTQVLYRMPSLPSLSKPIPSFPRPALQSQTSDVGGQTQSVLSISFQQHSAPMKVPVLSKAMMMERRRNLSDLADVADDGDGLRRSQILNLQQIGEIISAIENFTRLSILP